MTSAFAMSGGVSGLISATHSTAQSESAKNLLTMQEQIRSHLLSSYAISHPAEGAILALKRSDSRLPSRDGTGMALSRWTQGPMSTAISS